MSRIRLIVVTITLGLALGTTQTFAQSKQTGTISLPIRAVEASEHVVLGQDNPAGEKKSPGLFDRIKRSLKNLTRDEEDVESSADVKPINPQGKPRATQSTSIPTTPPKPMRAAELQEATEEQAAEQRPVEQRPAEQRERSTTLERRMANASGTTATESAASETKTETMAKDSKPVAEPRDQEESIYDRLKNIREQFFDDVPETRQHAVSAPETSRPVRETAPVTVTREPVIREMRHDPPREVVVETETTVRERPIREELRSTTIESAPRVSQQTVQTRPIRNTTSRTVESWNEESVFESNRTKEPIASRQRVERSEENKLPPLSGIAVPNDSPWNRLQTQDAAIETRNTTSRRDTVGGIPSRNDLRTPSEARDNASGKKAELSTGRSLQPGGITVGSAKPDKEKATLVSPQLEVETEGNSRIIVGQESTYRIRVRNRGGAAAEQVVLTVEVPNWIEILPPDVSTGTTSIVPKDQNKESRDFLWKISRIDASADEQLVLHLVPQQRKTVDLRIRYDFYKPSVLAKIFVQEPVIEMELQGPSEVLWGTQVGYKLLVRNTGNGDAENVMLELLQTGSDVKSCPLPLLRAGEEEVVDVDVWTGKQEHIDINIVASGAYDLKSEVAKRVVVLRPEITIGIESSEMQFVDSPAEFFVTVKNDGTAPATDLELVATIPLGARYVSNTSGGQATPQNQVIWNIPAIQVGDTFSASIICEPKREGLCKLDATINDRNGQIAHCSGAFNAEAIADLRMQVDNPQGPIEVGQEAVYTINVVNRGTKTAEDVDVIAAFGRGLEPFAIEGGNGTMNDGQVVFDRIPAISAGQTIVLKVKGKADKPGNHRMRTEVICPGVNTHLVFEQATYFYQKYKGKDASLASSTGKTSSTVLPKPEPASATPPTPLGSIRGGSEPLPLRGSTSTANRSDDPFLR